MNHKKVQSISVVMLNYNGLKYLSKTILPILELDYPNYEFVIVDNGSTDGSVDFIRNFKKIKLIENGRNLGYSKGKNIGIKEAEGDLIFLLDNDVVLNNKDILNVLVSFYKKKVNVGFVSFPVYNSGSHSTNMYYYHLSYNPKAKDSIDLGKIQTKEFYPTVAPSGANMFFEKKTWDILGGFDEIQPYYLDDHDIGPRSVIFGYSNYFITNNILEHLGFDNSKGVEEWSRRFGYYFSGLSFSYLKNCNIPNALKYIFLSDLFCFLRAIRHAVIKRSFLPVHSFIFSNYFFIRNLYSELKKREIIQKRRVIKEDIFLKIIPPKFN